MGLHSGSYWVLPPNLREARVPELVSYSSCCIGRQHAVGGRIQNSEARQPSEISAQNTTSLLQLYSSLTFSFSSVKKGYNEYPPHRILRGLAGTP